jgi:hypothetical protein
MGQNRAKIGLVLCMLAVFIAADCGEELEIIHIPDGSPGNTLSMSVVSHNKNESNKVSFDLFLYDRFDRQVGETIKIDLGSSQTTATTHLYVNEQFVDGEYTFKAMETVFAADTINGSVTYEEVCGQTARQKFNIESPRKSYNDIILEFEVDEPWTIQRINKSFKNCNNGACSESRVDAVIPKGWNFVYKSFNVTYDEEDQDWREVLIENMQPTYSHGMLLDMWNDHKDNTNYMRNLSKAFRALNKTVNDNRDFMENVRDNWKTCVNKLDSCEAELMSLENKEAERGFFNEDTVSGVILGFFIALGGTIGAGRYYKNKDLEET